MRTLLAAVPVEPDEPTARQWLERELAKPAYRNIELPDFNPDHGWTLPGGPWALVLLGLVLTVIFVLVSMGLPRLRHAEQDGSGAVFDGAAGDSGQLRRRAAELAAAGSWSQAVREMFRALVRGLQERTLVDERPGLTADEAAREASLVLPGLGPELSAAAVAFDRVVFGRKPAAEEDYRRMADLEEQVRRTRPVLDSGAGTIGLAVPR